MSTAETVFISYSHDGPDHVREVLSLSNRLRSDGIDCVLDQYEDSPPEGWPRWMDRQIRAARFVLMICTRMYYRRVMGEEKEGEGLGIKWEGNLIYQHLYDSGSVNDKFIPVLLQPSDRLFVPTPVRGSTHYCLAEADGYERLYARLCHVPRVERPPLGRRRSLPEKKVRTNVALYLSVPIDIEAWNLAKWSAVFYLLEPNSLPILGLGFQNEEPTRKIFTGWRERFGPFDEFEELRVAIIEGAIPGVDPGYSVHIGPAPDNTLRRYREKGFQIGRDLILAVSRLHRMEAPDGSPLLQAFKKLYRRQKAYYLIPGLVSFEKHSLVPFRELGLRKGAIVFRDAGDIGANDIDRPVIEAAKEDR